MTNSVFPVARRIRRHIPPPVRARIRTSRERLLKPGFIARFGVRRNLVPISRDFGFERGTPIDRYYIDEFLQSHSGLSEYVPGVIRGHVLEIGEDTYTRRFGTGVTRVDILDASTENPRATIVADLTDGSDLSSDVYDCIICPQTLFAIYDIRAAIATLHRILKPGGVLLVTVPGIAQISRVDFHSWGDYWRFTTLSARRLCQDAFDAADVSVRSYGNVLSASAFLYGLTAEDMRRSELDLHDPDYQITIGIKAVK